MEYLLILTTSVATLTGLISANLYIRKIRQAEVRAKETANKASALKNESREMFNAWQMIELVRKANQEVLETQRAVFRQKQEHVHTLLLAYTAEIRRLKSVVKQLEDTIGSMKSQVK